MPADEPLYSPGEVIGTVVWGAENGRPRLLGPPQPAPELMLERCGQDEVHDPLRGVHDEVVRRSLRTVPRDIANRIPVIRATGSRSVIVIAPVSRASACD